MDTLEFTIMKLSWRAVKQEVAKFKPRTAKLEAQTLSLEMISNRSGRLNIGLHIKPV